MLCQNGNNRAIPIVAPDISYNEFLNSFLRPLKPCIITGLTKDWPAAHEWTTRDPATGQTVPKFSTLRDIFGSYQGCITFCDELDINGDARLRELRVSQFIDDFFRNLENGTSQKTYLKDFHFMRVNEALKAPYTVPKFFQGSIKPTLLIFLDDWFNRYAIANDTDDFRFLYLGEDGSFTPLHHDVCMSHSWSTSLCGSSLIFVADCRK